LESGLRVVQGEELDRLAGVEKCMDAVGLSLADCYALALAKAEGALLLTTDSGLAKVAEAKVRHLPV
jgi:predicted nucleic acid-binding protein